MARTKLKKLSKLSELKNIFNIKQQNLKGELGNFFNDNKIFTLEIGCGHGDYSIELAKKYLDRKFVGIDVKGARLYNGAIRANELQIENVAFIITKAEWLNKIFEPGSIEEIYIPFPEPHLKRSVQDRRLVSANLLNSYKSLLINNGRIHFKTDNEDLFQFAVKNILNLDGKIIYLTENLDDENNIKYNYGVITSFEKHYIKNGRAIKYVCFKF